LIAQRDARLSRTAPDRQTRALFERLMLSPDQVALYKEISLMTCTRCDNTHWVCENHPDRPWEGPKACGCGGAGEPCPDCNKAAPDEMPVLPKGFDNSLTSIEVMCSLVRNSAGKPRRKPQK
jgi:hypothetical protein